MENSNSAWDNVTVIRENDVLLGRGSRSNQVGNLKFRQLIKDNRFRYLSASKVDKPKIAEEVVEMWRKMNPPGRFLSRKDEDEVEGNRDKKDECAVWHDVGDKKARLKASMALRERTPEAVHFLQMMRKREAQEAERTTMFVKQRLRMHGQFLDSDVPDNQGPIQEEVYTYTEPVTTNGHAAAPLRRASFAGFTQPRRNSNPYIPYHPPPPPPSSSTASMPMPQPPYPHEFHVAHPTRRSSLLGARHTQLNMMQQSVQERQRQVQMEIERLEKVDLLERNIPIQHQPSSFSYLPSIPDVHNSQHSQEDSFPINVNPSHGEERQKGVQNFPGKIDTVVSNDDYTDHDMTPLHRDHVEDSGDILSFEKYHSLLSGWAEHEKGTSTEQGGVDGNKVSLASARKRGVDRSVSGCSVQSTLSDLMAMSIISGADDDFVGLDKSEHMADFD